MTDTCHAVLTLMMQWMYTGKPARGLDVVEDKTELASLLEAEKSRRRLLEQRFSTAQEEADKLRYCFDTLNPGAALLHCIRGGRQTQVLL